MTSGFVLTERARAVTGASIAVMAAASRAVSNSVSAAGSPALDAAPCAALVEGACINARSRTPQARLSQ